MMRAITLLAAALLLTGCAHTARTPSTSAGVGSASYRTAADTGLAHYQLALGQVAVGAALQSHAAPVYPVSMLAACPALSEVPARVIVAADGRVSEVRMAQPSANPAFVDAVRQAVQRWRYTPLTISRWAADADGNSHEVDSETRPFTLAYVFEFRCRAGHATVATEVAKPR